MGYFISYAKKLKRKGTFFVRFTDGIFDTILIDGAKRRSRHFQRDPLARRRNEKTLRLQVRIELALRLIVSVGNVISNPRSFSGNLTNLSHDLSTFANEGAKMNKTL